MAAEETLPIEEIAAGFWAHFRKGRPVELVNHFHGVPVVHKAHIIMTGQHYLALSVHPHQAVCIALEGKTTILGKSLPGPVRARPLQVDVRGGQVILCKFVPAAGPVEKRRGERLHLTEPLPIELIQGGRRLEVALVDVTPQGVNVLCPPGPNGGSGVDRGEPLRLTLRIPGEEKAYAVEGSIQTVRRKRDGSAYRLGIDANGEAVLRDFIARYEVQVLRELEKALQVLRKRKGKGKKPEDAPAPL